MKKLLLALMFMMITTLSNANSTTTMYDVVFNRYSPDEQTIMVYNKDHDYKTLIKDKTFAGLFLKRYKKKIKCIYVIEYEHYVSITIRTEN